MARKKKKSEDNLGTDNGLEEEKGGGIAGALLAVAIIVIWLVIFALLIKMDVGGVGSMLRPFLKNVPVINRILPDKSDEELMEETGYKYKNLAEAVDRIKELEDQLAQYQNNGAADSDQIAQLKAEVERLKVYEDNQENFLKQKEEFDREDVFTHNAPDIEEYKKWYEQISPDNAAQIYKEVCEKIQYSQKIQDWATTYAAMDAADAAAIMQEMTGDTDIVSKILLCMKAKQRAAILAEMDPVYAGKLTKIMRKEDTKWVHLFQEHRVLTIMLFRLFHQAKTRV